MSRVIEEVMHDSPRPVLSNMMLSTNRDCHNKVSSIKSHFIMTVLKISDLTTFSFSFSLT